MNELDTSSTPPRPNSASPPPKCAICLGTCTNKCFSDSCMHQFCFTCLLEWSKVKAECPLCKQPFKSIIHNIKSNDEYEEHFITTEVPDARGILDNEEFLYLPPAPSRHFQFRTTFTVDPGGELAIQQMLLSHPLTNTLYNVPDNYILPRQSSRFGRLRHTRRASSATSFRRSIYLLNMWVYAPPDITGRYRDVTPHFYRDNPASRNRLVPWLNRELNALLRENTQQVMHLVDVIMEHLQRWHIRSRSFRQLLSPYLTNKTDHFIHEFYNFMRSPYDMIGYDRHIVYTDRPHSPTYLISDREDDSDVAIVNISEPIAVNNNPFRRPTIEVIEIDSDTSRDSDVIIGEPPTPEVVLVDSDSDDISGRTPEPHNSTNNNNLSDETEESEVNRKPILPLKIRLKRKRQSREKRSRNKKRSSKRYHSSTSRSRSSSTSSDSSDSSTSSNDSSHKRSKRRHKYKKSKSRSHKDHKSRSKEKSKSHVKTAYISDSSSSDNEPLLARKRKLGFDTDDSLPLSKIKTREMRKKPKRSRPTSQGTSTRTHTITSRNSPSTGEDDAPQNTVDDEDQSKPSCSQWKPPEVGNTTNYEHVSSSLAPVKPSTPSNSLPPSTSNVFDDFQFHIPDAMSQYKYEQYNPYVNNSQNGSSLPQFDNIPHYDTFQPYAQYRTPGRYSPSSIGNRYYDGPDYRLHRNSESYTPPPPLAHNTSTNNSSTFNNYLSSKLLYRNECNCESSHRECSGYNCEDNKLLQFYPQQNVEVPSRVNIGVGTSPIKHEIGELDYSNYCSGPSSSRRLQSVIVKKEEKENPNLYHYYLNADTTDSDG